jgi:xylan 1,4-beta-xylosidase
MDIEKSIHKIIVECSGKIGPFPAIWRSFGYDELNWTYTPRGKQIFHEIGKLSSAPYYIRCHHAFSTGIGLSTPTKGSGNIYQFAPDGKPQFNFTILDQVIETFLQNGCKPIVELGFMPDVLSSGPQPKPNYDYSTGDLWKYPPKDYQQWQELVYETVKHFVAKYGEEEVSRWYWEVWNEPDTPNYFKGSVKDYCKMYDYAAAAATAALPTVKIGGPALAHHPQFLQKFLEHCARGKNYVSRERGSRLNFISVHAKGTGWPLVGEPFEMPSLRRILSQLQSYHAVLQQFSQFADLEILVDECDMAVGTNFGMYDFPEYEFHNTEYYPTFVIRMAKALLGFMLEKKLPIKLFTTWAFYFEGKRFFEGNRALFTNENIKNPIFNAFVLLEGLGETRLRLITDSPATGSFPQVDGLATIAADGSVAVVIWNFDEDAKNSGAATLHLELRGLPAGFKKVFIERFQIDHEHSNSYCAWKKIGAPQNPTPEQIEYIKKHENLKLVESKNTQVMDGVVQYVFDLPMHGVALVKVSPCE